VNILLKITHLLTLIARPPILPTAEIIQSPSPGSETDDEMPGSSFTQDTTTSTASPPVPSRPFPSVPGADQSSSVESIPTRNAPDKRASRPPPPVPVTSQIQTRALPPTPSDIMQGRTPKTGPDGESEYEGDYDTDIASGVKHKDALKSHAKEPSMDDSTLTDATYVRSPPPLPPLPVPASSRPVPRPPPPPSQPPGRPSMDSARPGPPPIPMRSPQLDNDVDYDPFNYSGAPSVARTPSLPRVPTMPAPSAPAPPLPPIPPRNQHEDEDDSDDDLYEASPRKPTGGPPPLPPQAPPIDRPAPPPIPSEPSSPRMTRPSGEEDRSYSARRSVEQGRSSIEQGSIARDVDLARASQWWAQPDAPPPVFQNRSDLFYEVEENQTKQRGGKTTVSKDVYVLFKDYSQTVITVRFDAKSLDDVIMEQRHEPPPHSLRQDQLEEYWNRYGTQVITALNAMQNITVGDGSPHALVAALLQPLQGALAPVGTRAFGAPVYANLANASIQQFDEIRPGDIVSFRNTKFQGKHGGVMHQKYHLEAGKPDHVGIVVEWDGTKKKIRAAEQGRDVKEGKKGKVGVESFRLGDLRSGEVRVWRIVGRDYVGWE
jgi:myosin tail region-interacting protein MTI1